MKEEHEIKYDSEKGIPVIDLTKTKKLHTGLWRIFRPVFNDLKCIRCKNCYTYCPEAAVSWKNNKPEIDYSVCKGCLICVNECPTKALTAVKEK